MHVSYRDVSSFLGAVSKLLELLHTAYGHSHQFNRLSLYSYTGISCFSMLVKLILVMEKYLMIKKYA